MKYNFDYELGSGGLPYIPAISGALLTVEQHGKSFSIIGNREGLLFLAHNLIALAQISEQQVQEGYHIHLDDLFRLNDKGIELILNRE
jgi:hypothetical protein